MLQSREECGNRFQFSTLQLFDAATFCSALLGFVVAPYDVAQFASFAGGMLLLEITGRQWRYKIIRVVASLAIGSAVGLGFWGADMQDGNCALLMGTTLMFGLPIAILATSFHNFDSGQYPIKGVIGVMSFGVLASLLLLPSVH